ncbi:MAG TPA: ADP-forming succinate--CoA ligase subunit beta [Phycisphaerales bacterium]|nr:ADP-forming succinate--CoA ligase subunit beta [Phycisphaerales bacterium]
MKIHEYQARDLLASAGIPVPAGRMITSIEDAAGAFKEVTAGQTSPLAVVKAQVHAGGRGKAGFVKLCRTAEEATAAARFMFTNRMHSPQTPAEGLEVRRLLVAAGVDIAERKGGGNEEFYVAITTDRMTRRNVLIASREGGVEIEKIAHERPEAIIKEPLHPLLGLQPFQARNVAYRMGLSGKLASQAADAMLKLAKLFVEHDCTLAEINPLVVAVMPASAQSPTGGPAVVAIDAKFSFDENGLFRHKNIVSMADHSEENPAELRAQKFNLSYVALDGNIGCLVNGAGLAMATMDIIKHAGGEPANFLDVGGGATEEAVTEAFGIILSDPRVEGVLVNIFGGIMDCAVIARGIINAATGYKNADGTTGFKVPLVVRLEGTNVEAGRKLLADARAKLPTLQPATDLGDAAKRVCAAVA